MINTIQLLVSNIAFMGIQLVIVLFLNYFYSLEASGSYFYTLAVLSPLYLFFSMGAKQLYLSGVLEKKYHLTFRFLGMALFLVFGGGVVLTGMSEPLVVVAILFFKLYENIQDYKTSHLMVEEKYVLLVWFQLIRLLLFSAVLISSSFFMEKWEYCLLLASISIILPSLTWKVFKIHALDHVLLKKGAYLGAGMFLVNLTVSLPKIEIEKFISLDDFGALQTLIYMTVLGQLVVNVLASKSTIITAMKSKRESFNYIIKSCTLLSLFIILFLILMFENIDFLFKLITSHSLEPTIKNILPLLFFYIFIALNASFIEKFSTIFGVERQHFNIYFLTLILCAVLTYTVIPSFKLQGYIYVLIFITLLKMLLLVAKFYYASRK